MALSTQPQNVKTPEGHVAQARVPSEDIMTTNLKQVTSFVTLSQFSCNKHHY